MRGRWQRGLVLLGVLVVVAAGCDAGGDEAAPSPDPTGSAPGPTATSSPSPVPQPSPSSATDAPTDAPTADGSDPAGASPTEEPVGIVVGPDAPLLGVPLGADADAVVADLTAVLGAPDEDTGWGEGCPLDDPGVANERYVSWGPVTANLRRDGGSGRGTLDSWVYRLDAVTPTGVLPERVELPGGARMGDTVDEVVAATGLAADPSETFQLTFLEGGGYQLLADGLDGSAPVTIAAVPYQPLCE